MMQLDTRQHNITEDGAERLILEVTRQAVRDAQRGDVDAHQWLEYVMPGITDRLAMGWRARTRRAKAA